MQIKRTSSPILKAKPAIQDTSETSESKDKSDRITDVVVKGAYASGGALAGVGLGVVTGGVMASLTNTPSLATVGGVLGAVGGAGTAVSLMDSENKAKTLGQMALGWGGAAAGAAAGQWAVGGLVGNWAEAAGYQSLALAAPFIGTAAGSIVGARLPIEMVDAAPRKLSQAAGIAGIGTVGLAAGTAAKAFVATMPGVEHMIPAAPALGAVAGAGVGLYIGSEEGNEIAESAAKIGVGGALMYGVAAVAGGMAHSVGGHGAYATLLPGMGAVAGGLLGYGAVLQYDEERTQSQSITHQAGMTLAGTGAGLLAGDALGHAMADIAGLQMYKQVGFAIGAFNGAVNGLAESGIDTKNVREVAMGGTAGFVAGAAIGHGLTALTGDSIYTNAGAAVGALNGGLLTAEGMGVFDSHGVATTAAGATAGLTVGTLMGASLDALTGQSIWGATLPVLGATAGGLTSLAVARTSAAAPKESEE